MRTVNKRPRTRGVGSIADQLHHQEISRSKRCLPPAHYSLKVRPFSLLSKVEKYESGVFEAGGYKWRLVLHPNGDKKGMGEDYVSLYLALAEADNFPGHQWEVNVNFKLFIHDQIEDKYLTIQDNSNGSVKRFHKMKTTWGFAQLLLLETFKDPSNGYLVDDTCVFGVEVFVIKRTGNWESLSLVMSPSITNPTFRWEIEKFSSLNEEWHDSKVFRIGGKTWFLSIAPNGQTCYKGKSLSLYLKPSYWENDQIKAAIYAEYKLRLLDQVNGKHIETSASHCFGASGGLNGWGYPNFISLEDLRKPSNGFIVKDGLMVEVEFIVVSETKCFIEVAKTTDREESPLSPILPPLSPIFYED